MKQEPPGISLSVTKQIDVAALVQLVQLAEHLGYGSIWIPETWGSDAASVLAVLATATHRMQIASGILNVYSRSAALIAQTAATLQTLSGGRFILGLGASGPVVIEDWHGIPYGKPLRRTREYIEVIRLALSGKPVHFDGELLHLQRFSLQNPPLKPVPIYLAALGPKNIRLAGEIADGWLPIFAAHGVLPSLLSHLETGAATSGRSIDDMKIAAYLPAAVGPRGELLLRQQLAYYVGGMGTFYADFLARAGLSSDVEEIRNLWEAGNRRAAVAAVSPTILRTCTLGSTIDEAHQALDEFRQEGVHVPVVTLPHGISVDEARATIEALAPA